MAANLIWLLPASLIANVSTVVIVASVVVSVISIMVIAWFSDPDRYGVGIGRRRHDDERRNGKYSSNDRFYHSILH